MNPETLEKALSGIRASYGNEAVRLANTYPDPPRISTRSLELDIITGGGVPLGRFSHFYGGKFSAKTLTAYNVIASAQAEGYTCALYDVEKQFVESWAKKHGIDTDKLIVVEGTQIEDIGTKMEALLGAVHLHVIDSLPAAVSVDELASDSAEWRPGISARAWGKVLRRVNERFDREENAVIMINHIGTSFNKYTSEEPKGARFVEYLSSLSIEFKRSSWLFRSKEGHLKPDGTAEASLSGDKEASGIEFQARVNKSRVSIPFKTARMRLDFSTGMVDDEWSIVKAAPFYGLIQKKAGWYALPDGTKINGEDKFREYLSSNPEFKETVVKAMKGET